MELKTLSASSCLTSLNIQLRVLLLCNLFSDFVRTRGCVFADSLVCIFIIANSKFCIDSYVTMHIIAWQSLECMSVIRPQSLRSSILLSKFEFRICISNEIYYYVITLTTPLCIDNSVPFRMLSIAYFIRSTSTEPMK